MTRDRRDLFAAAALQGYLSGNLEFLMELEAETGIKMEDKLSEMSASQADVLIKELDKEKEE